MVPLHSHHNTSPTSPLRPIEAALSPWWTEAMLSLRPIEAAPSPWPTGTEKARPLSQAVVALVSLQIRPIGGQEKSRRRVTARWRRRRGSGTSARRSALHQECDVVIHTATKIPLMHSFSGNSPASAPISTFTHSRMNVEIGTETPIFLFWEYLFQNFGILSLQCSLTCHLSPYKKLSLQILWFCLFIIFKDFLTTSNFCSGYAEKGVSSRRTVPPPLADWNRSQSFPPGNGNLHHHSALAFPRESETLHSTTRDFILSAKS